MKSKAKVEDRRGALGSRVHSGLWYRGNGDNFSRRRTARGFVQTAGFSKSKSDFMAPSRRRLSGTWSYCCTTLDVDQYVMPCFWALHRFFSALLMIDNSRIHHPNTVVTTIGESTSFGLHLCRTASCPVVADCISSRCGVRKSLGSLRSFVEDKVRFSQRFHVSALTRIATTAGIAAVMLGDLRAGGQPIAEGTA